MFQRLKEDIQCILVRDPAARSVFEVLTCYPGLHALLLHRVAHVFWRWGQKVWGFRWLARFTSHLSRFFTGIEIHPGATIGRRVFIDHGMGVVVGETADIGDDCTIYQGVTLGGTSLTRGAKRHPTLERGVIVGAHAHVGGGFTVGEGARIGSSAVVTKPVPAGCTAVGNPARIIGASLVQAAQATGEFSAYGVSSSASQEDPLSQALHGLIQEAGSQSHQIALLWQAIEKLAHTQGMDLNAQGCVPPDAQKQENFDAGRLNKLVD